MIANIFQNVISRCMYKCTINLNQGCNRTCSQRHQPPPEAVKKCPLYDWRVFLGVEHEARKRQHGDPHQYYEQPQLFVCLIMERICLPVFIDTNRNITKVTV